MRKAKKRLRLARDFAGYAFKNVRDPIPLMPVGYCAISLTSARELRIRVAEDWRMPWRWVYRRGGRVVRVKFVEVK